MANILEIAKNIHPSHTLSGEELHARYIEIYPAIKREIEFFIEVYPQKCAPLFLSGQIGSGKTTLLKSLMFQNPLIHYFDISDLTIVDPKNSLEVSFVILYKILQITSTNDDLSSIEYLISRTQAYDPFDDFDSDIAIENIIRQLKNDITSENKVIIIDGLDRFLEFSDYKTIKGILFDHAFMWKALEQKLIFVTPLLFTQMQSQLIEYSKNYQADELDKTHLTIPVPDPSNISLWKTFISVRAQMDDLALSDQQISRLVELSGGLLRSTLVILRHLLNLMYRNGDVIVTNSHLEQLGEDVKKSMHNLMQRSSLIELETLVYIDKEKPSSIPENAISFFTRDIPLAILTQKDGKFLCILHPLLDISTIDSVVQRKKNDDEKKHEELKRALQGISF